MRVTLDLDVSAPDRPMGRLSLDGHGDSIAFDGWLDLMRVVESLAGTGDVPGGRPADGEERET
jgi:hypothetical protein